MENCSTYNKTIVVRLLALIIGTSFPFSLHPSDNRYYVFDFDYSAISYKKKLNFKLCPGDSIKISHELNIQSKKNYAI